MILKNFWTQWIIITSMTIVGACVIGALTHSWIVGIISYFVLGIMKDGYLMAFHTRKLDNNSNLV